MNQPMPTILIEPLLSYSAKDASDLAKLLRILDDSFSNEPVDMALIEEIISSPYHEQLVARIDDGTIVGTLTVSITMGLGVKHKAWLEDFIVNPEFQSMGIGGKLWDEALHWCLTHRAKALDFTSRPSKAAAQQFYLRKGAIIRETNYFRKSI